MVGATASARGRGLPGPFCALLCGWSFLLLCALPPLAVAAQGEGSQRPTACPQGPSEAYQGPDDAAAQQYGLRGELARVCSALAERLDAAGLQRADALAGLSELHTDVNAVGQQLLPIGIDLHRLVGDVGAEAGLGVRLLGQAGALEVLAPQGVEVANPPDVQAVRAAVLQGSETGNQNLWALAGLLTGFGLLAVLYKVVRP